MGHITIIILHEIETIYKTCARVYRNANYYYYMIRAILAKSDCVACVVVVSVASRRIGSKCTLASRIY